MTHARQTGACFAPERKAGWRIRRTRRSGKSKEETLALVRKTVTHELVTANRANAAKSAGPRTELGKARSAMNAGRHLVLARIVTTGMKQLGEDPAEFESFRESIFQAFAPADGFETMLVQDMVQIRWRLQRLQRAECAILALQKRKFETERVVKETTEAKGIHTPVEGALISVVGIAGMENSRFKYAEMLEKLRALSLGVQSSGFEETGRSILDWVYGPTRGLAGSLLKRRFERYAKEQGTAEPEQQARNREDFLKDLGEEIGCYERLESVYHAMEKYLAQPMTEAQLLLANDQLQKVMRYETALENRFERKLGQLAAWRMMRERRRQGEKRTA